MNVHLEDSISVLTTLRRYCLLGAGFFEAVISDKKPTVEKSLKTLNALLHEDAKIILKRQQDSKTPKNKVWKRLRTLL